MEDPRHEGTELEGEGAGFKGKIRGFRIADLVLAIIVVYALVVKPYLDSEREAVRDASLAKEHAAIAAAQEAMAVAFTEFSYIISLPQDQRATLNMGMPQSLRDKLYLDRRAR